MWICSLLGEFQELFERGKHGKQHAAIVCDGGVLLFWSAALQERILLLGRKEESRGLLGESLDLLFGQLCFCLLIGGFYVLRFRFFVYVKYKYDVTGVMWPAKFSELNMKVVEIVSIVVAWLLLLGGGGYCCYNTQISKHLTGVRQLLKLR